MGGNFERSLKMEVNKKIALKMLDEIDLARSGSISLEELEQKLWRLLDRADGNFPLSVAGRVEELVLKIRERQRENLSYSENDPDENRGIEVLFNEVCVSLNRILS